VKPASASSIRAASKLSAPRATSSADGTVVTIRRQPHWINSLEQSQQGMCVTYAVHPANAVPERAALQMALASACATSMSLSGRCQRSGTSSSTPRGRPL
jgi:hypothetical protein